MKDRVISKKVQDAFEAREANDTIKRLLVMFHCFDVIEKSGKLRKEIYAIRELVNIVYMT